MTENVSMMWLKPPQHCYMTLQRQLRRVIKVDGAAALTEGLSDLCDEYWMIYSDMHGTEDTEERIQSWFLWQAMVKILKDYGWWDKNANIPINWTQQEVHNDTTGD
jgi:hypothetical protein